MTQPVRKASIMAKRRRSPRGANLKSTGKRPSTTKPGATQKHVPMDHGDPYAKLFHFAIILLVLGAAAVPFGLGKYFEFHCLEIIVSVTPEKNESCYLEGK